MKDLPLLVLKDNIIDGDGLWTAEGYPGFFFGGIRLDKSDGKSEGFPVESSDGATLGLINRKVLSVAYYSKLGRELGSKEYALLGLSEGDFEGITKDIVIGIIEGCV